MSDDARANLEAEQRVIGSILTSKSAFEMVMTELDPSDFYRPGFGTVFAAAIELHSNGMNVDPMTVADVLGRLGRLDEIGGITGLLDLARQEFAASNVRSYASIVRREAAARRLDLAALEARTAIAAQADPITTAEVLEDKIRELDRGGRLPERYWRSADDYLAQPPENVGVPLIEGMSNHHTRTIILATEKAGKSLLIRAFAFCAAAGIHPFTFKPIEPIRVLLVDAENDDDELVPTMGQIRTMVENAGGAAGARPAILSAPYGMDLRARRDRGEFEEVLSDTRPQIIMGGPIYKLLGEQSDNTSDPRHAERLQRIFDDIRKRWGCALMMEHHAPFGKSGEQREIRSIGGQRWAAWPEVTIALHAHKGVGGIDSLNVRFPHPPRGRFRWPKRFDRATTPDEWLWTPIFDPIEDRPPLPEPPPELDMPF